MEQLSLDVSFAQNFYEFFSGYEKAKGLYTITGVSNNGKVEGRASTLLEQPTMHDWELHLAGKQGLGIIPIRADDTCYFGALDIDERGIDLIALEQQCGELPVVIARSKSGGAHVYVFFSEPVPASLVQSRLENWAASLGYGGCEVFPKQTKRDSDKDVGNWINMPYFKGNATERAMYHNGKPISVEAATPLIAMRRITLKQFESIVLKMENSPEDFYTSEKPQKAGRNGYLFSKAMGLRKVKDNKEFVTEKLNEINLSAGPEDHPNFADGPVDEKELSQIIRSAMKYDLKKYRPNAVNFEPETIEWTLPHNILSQTMPVPPFPLSFLPGAFGDVVEDVSDRMQTSSDYAGIPMIVSVGAVIGNSAELQLKAHDYKWAERSSFYGVCIGLTGEIKTPPADAILDPLKQLESKLDGQFIKAKKRYEEDMKKCENDGSHEKPEMPLRKTVLINNYTTEALCKTMLSNPKGFMIYRDELSGFFASFNKYRSGNGDDRQAFLEFYSGGMVNTVRKGDDQTFVDKMFLAIFGTIQPEVVEQHFRDGGDGLPARFCLAAYPDPRKGGYVDELPDKEAAAIVSSALEAMWNFNSVPEHGQHIKAQRYKLNGEARSIYQAWHLNNKKEKEKLNSPELEAVFNKYDGLFARLCLAHWFMRHYAQIGNSGHAPDPAQEVDVKTAKVVADFIDEYLKPHAFKIYHYISMHPGAQSAKVVAQKIMEKKLTSFNSSTILSRKWGGLKTAADLRPMIEYLEIIGWVKTISEGHGSQGGRPSVTYYVNPNALAGKFMGMEEEE